MKTKISFFLLAAIVSAGLHAAETITGVWSYGTDELNADWSGAAPDWSNPDAVKAASCARFATAADGKIYTVNMKTMSIAEITADGWKDLYPLPKPETDSDYYGTALSCDQAGNFLVGHYFTKKPESSTVWSVFNPRTNTIERFELPVPADYEAVVDGTTRSGVGRIDCVGRVLGDLTGDAVFFIAPSFGDTAPFIRIVRISHDLSGKLKVESETSPAVPRAIGANTVAIAQPKDAMYADFAARTDAAGSFYMYLNNGGGATNFVSFSDNGAFDADLFDNPVLRSITQASTSGFDTFVIDGVRYFAINYLAAPDKSNSNAMDIAVIREDGTVMGTWKNPDYASQYGYSSIVAEPLADGTANIYVYNSTVKDGNLSPVARSAAAMVSFDPSKYVATDPSLRPGSSEDNPIVITTAEDLIALRSQLADGDNYIVLDADIDLNGIDWQVLCDENTRSKICLDGRGHVISNLHVSPTSRQNGSLIGNLTGWVRNLGLEDVSVSVSWYCVGGIAGVATDAVIENCYVTGTVTGAASGAIIGCNKGSVTISSCYSFCDTADRTGSAEYSGGLVGRADAPLMISNSYAACTVTSTGGHAGGIVSVQRSQSVTLSHVIAWNMAVDGKTTASPICAGGSPSISDCLFWDAMEVNGDAVTGGSPDSDLRKEIARWEAFSDGKVNAITGYPALNWQTRFVTASINDIMQDDTADSPAEYFNLHGIRTDHPSPGIYIVRRGTKVSKEIIR